MRPIFFQSLILIFVIQFQMLMAPYFQVLELKPNWVVLVLIHFSLKSGLRQLPVLGMLSGLCFDAISHGMTGVYGISFMLMVLYVQWLSTWFYSNSILFTMLAVFIISMVEGSTGLTLIKLLEPEISWNWSLFHKILPVSLLHALAAPWVFQVVTQLEQMFLRSRHDNGHISPP